MLNSIQWGSHKLVQWLSQISQVNMDAQNRRDVLRNQGNPLSE